VAEAGGGVGGFGAGVAAADDDDVIIVGRGHGVLSFCWVGGKPRMCMRGSGLS
jgi:hypothetical protein